VHIFCQSRTKLLFENVKVILAGSTSAPGICLTQPGLRNDSEITTEFVRRSTVTSLQMSVGAVKDVVLTGNDVRSAGFRHIQAERSGPYISVMIIKDLNGYGIGLS